MRLADKITLARTCLLPFMWVFALLKYFNILLILLLLNGVGDTLDGYIARRFKNETKFGEKFDSLCDVLVYLSVIIWSFLFFPEIYTKNLSIITILLILAISPIVFSLIKFKEVIFFHLISSKIIAWLITVSFFILILFPNLINYILILLLFTTIFNFIERWVILIHEKRTVPENIRSVFYLISK